MIIKQLSVFLENKSGRLTRVTEVLAEAGINMSAFSVADTADYGILRLITNKPEDAYKVLKEKEFSVQITDVIGLIVPHEPGGLYRALKILSSEGIDCGIYVRFCAQQSCYSNYSDGSNRSGP